MKKLSAAIAVLALPLSMTASTQWTLQGKTYNVDTVYHAKIGPGTTQTSLQLTGAQKLMLHYTTTDLTDPYVDIRVTKGYGKYVGCQTLSVQQRNADRAGARYFAGVNADFFGNSAPIGSTVVDGEVINTENNTWVNWYMTEDKKPHIATLGYKGTATFPGGATHAVAGINCGRYENALVVYNKRLNNSHSGTNAYGQEVSITPVEGSLGFNGKVVCRVTCAPLGAGSMAIPAGGYVLSGHGTAAALVKNLAIGDLVTLDMYPGLGSKITQMASGQPAILAGGVTLETQNALDHLTSLNPRTAVGFDSEGKKLVLLVVDGRSTNSVGVVSKVLADIMRCTGCTEAMNFDGGGSSELYTSAFGVRNRPSDGNERAVTDAAWCVATAPDDNTVAAISFVSPTVTLPKYGFYKPQIYAYNKYGVLINTALQGVTLSCDAALGTIVDDGTTLFANGGGYHALTAEYNGISATVPVTIGNGMPKMRLDGVTVDSYRHYRAEVTAAAGDLEMPVDNRALTWTSDDPSVATVDADGLIVGVSDGTTTINGRVEDFNGTLPVTVQIPTLRWNNFVAGADPAAWTISKSGMKDVTAVKNGDGFDLTYTVSSTRSPYTTIKMATDLHALPDSLRLVINPGDADITKITFVAGTKDQRGTSVAVTPSLTPGKDNVITVPVSDFVADPADFANYPLTLTSVAFYSGDANGSTHTLGVRALQTVHTALPYSSMDAIDDIVTADRAATLAGAERWYTTEGKAVTGRPAPGLYIRRTADGAQKVLVR